MHPPELRRQAMASTPPCSADGTRANNWATLVVARERRRYDYPRWQFVNASVDILALCTGTLDQVCVPWRRSGRRTVSVSTRSGVAALDEHVRLVQ